MREEPQWRRKRKNPARIAPGRVILGTLSPSGRDDSTDQSGLQVVVDYPFSSASNWQSIVAMAASIASRSVEKVAFLVT